MIPMVRPNSAGAATIAALVIATPASAQNFRSEYGGSGASMHPKCGWVKQIRRQELFDVWDRARRKYANRTIDKKAVVAQIKRIEKTIPEFQRERWKLLRELRSSASTNRGVKILLVLKSTVDAANTIAGAISGLRVPTRAVSRAVRLPRGTRSQEGIKTLVDASINKGQFLAKLSDQVTLADAVELPLGLLPGTSNIIAVKQGIDNFKTNAKMWELSNERHAIKARGIRFQLKVLNQKLVRLKYVLRKARASLQAGNKARQKFALVNSWKNKIDLWIRNNCSPGKSMSEKERRRLADIGNDAKSGARRDAATIGTRGFGAGSRGASRYDQRSRNIASREEQRSQAIANRRMQQHLNQMRQQMSSRGGSYSGGTNPCAPGVQRIIQSAQSRARGGVGVCQSHRILYQAYSRAASYLRGCRKGGRDAQVQAGNFERAAAQARQGMRQSCAR